MRQSRDLLVESKRKTTSEHDLLPFFHHWDEQRAAFHARAPVEVPLSIASVLDTRGTMEPALLRLLLRGNWIPTFFPQHCPDDVAKWL